MYDSPQPAFRDIVHQGRVSLVTIPIGHNPEAGGDGPDDPGEHGGVVRYLAFTDAAGGTPLYQGWAEGDSLTFGATHQGGDTFPAIRQ